ncbi:MAG: hypothetical protein R3C10_17840 [Pirellulales bacterium]
MFRNLLIAACIGAVTTRCVTAAPPAPVMNAPVVGFSQPEPPPQTLPEIEVRRPPEESPFEVPRTPTGGTIGWDSNAIYSDQQRVGPYNQPVWTTQRPWATTRVYVLPPGQAQVEQWYRATYPRNGKPKFRFLEEYAIGLPGRFQLDLYERWNVEPDENNNQEANHEGVQVELHRRPGRLGRDPLEPDTVRRMGRTRRAPGEAERLRIETAARR